MHLVADAACHGAAADKTGDTFDNTTGGGKARLGTESSSGS